jgi:hypothetical protein
MPAGIRRAGADGFVRGDRASRGDLDGGKKDGPGSNQGGNHGKGDGRGGRDSGGLVVSGHAGNKTSGSPYGYAHEGNRAYDHDWDRTYRRGFRHGYRVGYDNAWRDRYDGWYDRHRVHLSFNFGIGAYFGVRYYSPYRHWWTGYDYAFFHPAPVTYAYVPYGFYCDTTPVYVTRYHYVHSTAPVVVYETRETVTVTEVTEVVSDDEGYDVATGGDPEAADAMTKVEPVAAAGSPATEQFLRDGSDFFRKGEYYEAAVQFRLAALSAPAHTGSLFALSQALMAMGEDAYAAKVLRKAVEMDPMLLKETGDLVGVYRDVDEFTRVRQALEARAAAAPVDGDARFLLGALRYFTGDPRAKESFFLLAEAVPEDAVFVAFRTASNERFIANEDLPPIGGPAVAPSDDMPPVKKPE